MDEAGEIPINISTSPPKEVKSASRMLLEKADRIVSSEIPLITEKTESVSGDKRNFESLSPYHHLDEIGNPFYVDTVFNPNAENYQDPQRLKEAKNAIYICSLAAIATKDELQKEKYKNHAVSAINAWFIDEETQMNPSLEYAQMTEDRKGENCGNFWGIIDGAGLVQIVEGVGNLRDAGLIDEETLDGVKLWFGKYLNWLLTSEKSIGKKDAENEKERKGEKGALNNHGTFYDVQVAYIADFLGEKDIVKGAIQSTKERIKTQITPEGEMPEETGRGDMSLDYQIFNLYGLSQMAIIAERYGEDLWNYQTDDGRSMEKAFGFVYDQLKGKDKSSFRYDRTGELYFAFRSASQEYGIQNYWDLPERIYNDPLSSEVSATVFSQKKPKN